MPRADLIVVMFDAHKLDISDELKMVIDTLKPHHDKMRYVAHYLIICFIFFFVIHVCGIS